MINRIKFFSYFKSYFWGVNVRNVDFGETMERELLEGKTVEEIIIFRLLFTTTLHWIVW